MDPHSSIPNLEINNNNFVLSCAMTGPVRTSTVKKHVQPPRPPNAWILYRSEKIRTLPPLQPGEARRAQADVSRMISEMWKNESEEERNRYERMAEQKKAEHQQKYPGYRFQPQKKEEKQRLREMMKQEKQNNREARKNRGRLQASPTITTTSDPPTTPHFIPPFYTPETQYGPAGPSPPMSAAPSPQIDTAPSPAADESILNASQPPNNGQQPVPFPITIPFVFPDSHPAPWITPSSEWDHQDIPMLPAVGNMPTEFVSFDIPSLSNGATPWLGSGHPDELAEALQAFLSSTADPSIFHLNNIDVDLLTANPGGEIEVSMGQVPLAFENILSPDFTDFDFSNMAGPSSQSLDVLTSINDSTAPLRLSSGSSDHVPYNAEEFLNLDETQTNAFSSIPVPTSSETPPGSQSSGPTTSTVSTPCSNVYVPPSGAAYSSTRRVGGAWKIPPFIDGDSTMDHSPARPWRVPAN